MHLLVHASKFDPTQTTSIRRSYEAEMKRRFREIRKAIIQAIVIDDVFGIIANAPAATIRVSARRPGRREFAFPRSDAKVQAFMDWLADAESKDILGVQLGTPIRSAANKSWQNKYIKAAYSKSMQKAAQRLKSQGVKVEDSWLEQAFFRPLHADRVGLIYTRAYTSLSGITDTMDAQISRTLARGLVDGVGARQLARDIVDRVDSIGITRARALARTEVIDAAAEATLNSYAEAGVLGVETQAEFATAQDDSVCPECEALEGKIYPIDEASGIIPVHPNCRCAWLPVVTDPEGKVLR